MNNHKKNKWVWLVVCSLFCPHSFATEIKGVGKFLITAQVGKGWEIFIVNDDGTGEKKLTSTGGKASNPKWSPDGKCFAFLNKDILELSDENGRKVSHLDTKFQSVL